MLGNVEALLWLHYGVELGLFPEAYARSAILADRDGISDCLVALDDRSTNRYFPARVQSFLGEARSILNHGDELAAEFFQIRYAEGLRQDLVSTIAAEMVFHEIARASGMPEYRQFTELITFSSEDKWSALITADVSPDRILEQGNQPSDHLYAGYFAALDHMGFLGELLEHCADVSGTDSGAARGVQTDHTLLTMADRVRSMRLWRLDLDDPHTRGRFVDLTYAVKDKLDADAELSSVQFDSAAFLSRVETLCAGWLGKHTVAFPRLRPSAAA